jgi:hypothetical protein
MVMQAPARASAILIVTAMAAAILGWRVWAFYQHEYALPPNQDCVALERLNVRDARVAAAEDAQHGDAHLLGVYGYASELPGLDGQQSDNLPSNFRVGMLPCTSDGPVSVRHAALNDRARAYAAAYNKATLSAAGARRPQFATPTVSASPARTQ